MGRGGIGLTERRALERWTLLAITVVLVGASCTANSDSAAIGSPTTLSETSVDDSTGGPTKTAESPVRSSAPGARTDELGDYLVAVLESEAEAGVPEATATLSTSGNLQEAIAALRQVQVAVGRQADILESVTPPPDADAFHSTLVAQTRRYESWYADYADALVGGNEERIGGLDRQVARYFRESIGLGAQQQELIETVLASRSDPLSVYVLASTQVQTSFDDESQRLMKRVERGAPPNALDAALTEMIRLMDRFGDAWASIAVPPAAAEYHDQRGKVIESTKDALESTMSSLVGGNPAALRAAIAGMVNGLTLVMEVEADGRDLLITVLAR